MKCAAFWAMAMFAPAKSLYEVAQRRITGRFFQQLTPSTLAAYRYHVTNYHRLHTPGIALEFGAGRNLLTPLLLSAAGASRVYAYDIAPIATVEQVNDIIRQLRAVQPGDWPMLRTLEDLEQYRIVYCAPGDVSTTHLADGHVDFICSTSSLEHIPAQSIRAILRECKRIASPRALLSFIIDYHDHYATADARIGYFNFYRYSERMWRIYNPPHQHQNRLRHSDHEQMFAAAGFAAIENLRLTPPWAESDLARTIISSKFQTYSRNDLLTANGRFLLKHA